MTPDGTERFEQESISSDCKRFDEELAAYLEGAEGTRVLVHAAQCPACGGVVKDLQMIRSAAREMPLDSPSPRVWKKVRAALAGEGLILQPEPHWLGWLRAPGIPSRLVPATMGIAVAVLGFVFILSPKFSKKPAVLNPRTQTNTYALSASNASYTAEQLSLAKTVQQMELNFRQHETQLPPLIKSTYEKGLQSLDTSIQESLDSVRQDPQDELAREFLMRAYAQKADVLASAMEYDGNGN